MPDFQNTIFFQDASGSYGFSEPYYTTAADVTAGLTALEALIVARSKVLIDGITIVAGRISDVSVLNDSLLATNCPIDGEIVSTSVTAVDPWTALMARIEYGSGHRGRHFWHGVLEDTFLENRTYDPANPNAAKWTTWSTYVKVNTNLRYKLAGVYQYQPLTACILQREVEKKVGRPFNLLRGRRPT